MLRRGKSITGTIIGPNKTNVKTIKPSKTRKIIRRYHFLNQSKQKLLKLLKLEDSNNLLFDTLRSGNADFQRGCDMKRGDDVTERQLIKIHQHSMDSKLLYNMLGYVYTELADEKGLSNYQMASRMGQDVKRGGDSSKILIKWMKELDDTQEKNHDERKTMTALEIGSLSKQNKISTSGIFNPVVRIDLNNSNDQEGIIRQDFMERPIPHNDNDKFDLISCSLVLNFVPTPLERGQMCRRFKFFLKNNSNNTRYIFIVLPLPCLSNSRYITPERFHDMMLSLGYEKLRYQEAKKVCYALYQWDKNLENEETQKKRFMTKRQCRDGPKMNNFNILLSK
ncbi:similar to Saccharomyces cerevisiae YBR141C BMT2 Putative S-adenosylmethionine-dependent methyltransferase [Maudiozyma saulgeensis]|uniref:25S rRNA adenine-N(1) methyltransferase n=1 Tax=Maudiozyma saulgeensis TaxID=1789683 RepID=A0A1X7R2S9_9SACH|nr:similar to Saccharomyces cerevisiae YBR141C BMT2 Putative S-adenosylmethionine-dependent methyltransferase [Kazachstania saulgeensis]